MIVGESRICNMVLKMIGEEGIANINDYVSNMSSKDFVAMPSISSVYEIFGEKIDTFIASLSADELMDLRSYTGYNFRNINAILRGNWNYEINGALTQENRERFNKLSYSVSSIISKFEMPDVNLITFRGTTIDSFSSYSIRELSQLSSLVGKFIYEPGFTSTSMLEDTCYFNKNLEDGKNYNIEIRYLVPSWSSDGILLFNQEMTYSVSQNEFLIDKGTLSKVLDVCVDEKNNTAVITMLLIPKKVYDKGYSQSFGTSRGV